MTTPDHSIATVYPQTTAPVSKPGGTGHDYRPDIDGLRGVAVLAVILFHAHLGVAGGFVGVDIFFVISGYLISAIILREIRDGQFSFGNFWERRIRRIMPAATVMTVATLIVAWFLFMPADLEALGRSAAAQASLLSNVFFWRHAGYFAPAMDTKPLLHTWSLAIEEQFYVIFPLLLVPLARLRKISLPAVVIGLTAVSLILCILGTYRGHERSAFFLLPTRAWELLAGTLLAIAQSRWQIPRGAKNYIGWIGLGLCIFPIFAFTSSTVFPGAAAIIPCAGAVLVIASSQSCPSMAGRLLSIRPLVWVGLISYSLYLWHWPVLVFARYALVEPSSTTTKLGLVAVVLAISILSWRFVETPFRRKKFLTQRRPLFAIAVISIVGTIAAGFVLAKLDGVPSRLSPQAQAFASSRLDDSAWSWNEIKLPDARAGRFQELNSAAVDQPIEILVWGDSYAKAALPAIQQLCSKHSVRGIAATHSATAPVVDYESPFSGSLRGAPLVAEAVVKFVTEQKIPNVILISRWASYYPTDTVRERLLETIRQLKAAHARVFVVMEVPFPDFDVPRLAAITAMHGGDFDSLGITQKTYTKRNENMFPTFHAAAEAGATILDPTPYFRNNRQLFAAVDGNQALYADTMHLTESGAHRLIPLFESAIKK